MSKYYALGEVIRWKCNNGGELVLQVLRTENQGKKEIWMDVPIVFDEEEEFCQCSTAIIKDGIHCINCGLPYKSQRG
jgi:hypothetical protein